MIPRLVAPIASLVALVLLGATAQAQVDSVRAAAKGEPGVLTPDTTARRATALMDRTVSTFLWNLNAEASGRIGDGGYLLFGRLLRTFIPEHSSNAERIDATARISLSQPLVGDVRAIGSADVRNTIDNRSVGLSDVLRAGALAGISARPMTNAMATITAGGIVDRQIGIEDAGAQYLCTGDLRRTIYGEYELWGNGRSGMEFLGSRHNGTHGVIVGTSLRTGMAEIRAQAEATSSERDFYFVDSSIAPFTGRAYNIEARTESAVRGGIVMEYDVGGSTRMRVDGEMGDRTVSRRDVDKSALLPAADIDTRAREFRLNVGAACSAVIAGVGASAGVRHERYEETHSVVPAPENAPGALVVQSAVESQKNATARRTMVVAGLAIPTWRCDSIVISGSLGVLHYDTPDTLNVDDRDELDAAVHGAWSAVVNPWCTAGVRADIFLHHLVYLYASQSGSNAWNRIVRVAPFVLWTPAEGVSSVAQFEVLGNYTVYDFEGIVASVHSYAFRRMALRDSIAWRMGEGTWISGAGEFRWYEHGQLAWESFRERPADRVREWVFGGAAGTRVARDLTVEAGLQGFLRSVNTYAGAGTYAPGSSLTSIGPTARLVWIPHPGTGVSATGWYQVVHEGNNPTRVIPNLNIHVTWGM
jgi:hypothetical protein